MKDPLVTIGDAKDGPARGEVDLDRPVVNLDEVNSAAMDSEAHLGEVASLEILDLPVARASLVNHRERSQDDAAGLGGDY